MNLKDGPTSHQMVLSSLIKNEIVLNQEKWSLIYPRDYQEVMELSGQEREVSPEVKLLFQELVSVASSTVSRGPIRVQMNFRAVPLLVGIFPASRELLLASSRLHRELFLEENGLIDPQIKDHLKKLKSLEVHEFPTVIERTTLKNNLPNFLQSSSLPPALEKKAKDLCQELLQKIKQYSPSILERMTDFGLYLTANYALIRIHLLKFLAVLPSLDHDDKGLQVKRIFLETLRRLEDDSRKASRSRKQKNQQKTQQGEKGKGQAPVTDDQGPLPFLYILACSLLRMLGEKLPAKFLANFIRAQVRVMAKRFIAGESIEKAGTSLKSLRSTGREATLDQLGELVVSEKEAEHYCKKVLELITGLKLHGEKGKLNLAGIPCAHVSIKMSALSSDFNPLALDVTYKEVAPRLKKILIMAKEEEVFIQVDAEHYHFRDLVFEIFRRVLLETPELKDYKWVGIVIQAYLRDAGEHLKDIVELAKTRGPTMPVRLVKGAYWDAETVEADAHSFNAPQFLNKEESDLHFRQLMYRILESAPHLQLCLGSHNLADHCFGRILRQEYFPTAPMIEHQCLHMTYEALGLSMSAMGWPVRNYVPVGNLLVGMAYLVRRIMENSSQVGILNIMRSDRNKRGEDFIPPERIHNLKKRKGEIIWDTSERMLSSQFFNTPPLRLYLKEEKASFDQAFSHYQKSSLGKTYANSFLVSGDQVVLKSPSDGTQVVGEIQWATKEDAEKAVGISFEAYKAQLWEKDKFIAKGRSAILIKAAEKLLARRLEFVVHMMWEAGKSFKEAAGDVDEAIDFLNFYAREELRVMQKSPRLNSRGVIAVISPWNFPCAIPCGMVAAALVAGNTVILKSAEQSPLIAQKLVDLLHEAGVPQEVLIHLPGPGEIVGASLVEDPRVSGVVFTGSKQVGQWVASTALKRIVQNPLTQFRSPVKVITEMGGKNAIVVTGSAELDETVVGCLNSAFGHAGQKCSALSRIFADSSVKQKFLERLTDGARDMKVGSALNMSTVINPLISAEDKKRLQQQAEEACAEAVRLGGKVWLDRSKENLPGYSMGPVIIELPKNSTSTQLSQEFFGPILHVVGFDDLNEALTMVNSTDYALTGGIFSQSQDDIDFLLKGFAAGNIYINRSCTGARVAIEPFGGFKLSGTGPKAGGSSYVRAFHIEPSGEKASTSSWSGPRQGIKSQGPKVLSPGRPHFKNSYGQKVLKAFHALLDDRELFLWINKKEREHLDNFYHWLKIHLNPFLSKKWSNRQVPGLLSYNNFNLMKTQGLLISYQERPMTITLIDFLASMTLGCGVTILCRNFSAFKDWQSIVQKFRDVEIGEEFLSLYEVEEDELKQCLQQPTSSFVIVDGGHSDFKNLLPLIPGSQGESEKVMRAWHTPMDAPALDDFEEILKQFVCVRSFSVNTMRHGAPLAVDLED